MSTRSGMVGNCTDGTITHAHGTPHGTLAAMRDSHRLANIIGTDPLKSQDGHKWPARPHTYPPARNTCDNEGSVNQPDDNSSGNHQSIAKIQCIHFQQLSIALLPGAAA